MPRNRATGHVGNSPDPSHEENIRTEYEALSRYFNTVVTFRFTVLGFFLAALALLLSNGLTPAKALALFIIDGALYLVELRNRSLYDNLSDRGIQIERTEWGYRGEEAFTPFYSHMMKTRPQDDPAAPEPPPLDHPKWGNRRFELPIAVSHGCALDVLYLGIGAATMLYLLTTLCRSVFGVHIWFLGA